MTFLFYYIIFGIVLFFTIYSNKFYFELLKTKIEIIRYEKNWSNERFILIYLIIWILFYPIIIIQLFNNGI